VARAVADAPTVKRFKRDNEEPMQPSPVLHLRSLPLDVLEYEVRVLFPNASQIVKAMVLRGKGQAFVQFPDVDVAAETLRHFESHRPVVRYAPPAVLTCTYRTLLLVA
jgi:hypothetical protein